MKTFLIALIALSFATAAQALSLGDLSNKDAASGLKQALTQGAGKAVRFGLVKEDDAHLENYVTSKALDGLYLMIGEEERAIRKDPLGAAGSLAKKVFGVLRQESGKAPVGLCPAG